MSKSLEIVGMPNLQDISVVVLSHNRKEEIQKNIPRLCELAQETGFELIVVDNASTDGSRDVLRTLQGQYPFLHVVYNTKNDGVAGGRNLGWQSARRTFILNIDDDTWIDPRCIEAMREVFLYDKSISIVSPRIICSSTGNIVCDHGTDIYQPANFPGACHMIKRPLFKVIGILDRQCIFGAEELDYSIRARSMGYKVIYTPCATAFHKNFPKDKKTSKWRRKTWLFNFCRIYYKHFPIPFATMFAFQYCVCHIISGAREHGLIFAVSLPMDAARGAFAGSKSYKPVPRYVLKFYMNPHLRPDFGNVPLYYKICKHLTPSLDTFGKVLKNLIGTFGKRISN